MTRVLINGFETGDLSELQQVASAQISRIVPGAGGAYSALIPDGDGATNTYTLPSGGLAHLYAKVQLMFDDMTPPASGNYLHLPFYLWHNGLGPVFTVYLLQDTSGVWNDLIYKWDAINNFTAVYIAPCSVQPVVGKWFRYEMEGQNGSSGFVKTYINGTLSANTGTQNFLANNVDLCLFGSNAGGGVPRNVYFDDYEIDDAALPGDSYVIARQWTNVPAYYADLDLGVFTASTGGSIDTVWNDTPFDASTNVVSLNLTNALPLTARVQSFRQNGSGRGAGRININDTINAIKIAGIIKTSTTVGDGGAYLLLVANSVGSVGALLWTLTTSDAFYSTMFPGVTYDALDELEGGVFKWLGSAATQITVEDMWMMASYTPGALPSSTLLAEGAGG